MWCPKCGRYCADGTGMCDECKEGKSFLIQENSKSLAEQLSINTTTEKSLNKMSLIAKGIAIFLLVVSAIMYIAVIITFNDAEIAWSCAGIGTLFLILALTFFIKSVLIKGFFELLENTRKTYQILNDNQKGNVK